MSSLDLSEGGREFVGDMGLQPANLGAKNLFPSSRAAELMAPIIEGDTSAFTSVRDTLSCKNRPDFCSLCR